MSQAENHPQKGSRISADPITSLEDIEKVKAYLFKHPRNYAIFILAINTNLRIGDISKLTIGQVRNLSPGQDILLHEEKTGKQRRITMNHGVYKAIAPILKSLSGKADNEPLFQSEKTGKNLTVPTLSLLIKTWCRRAKIKGNHFSGHTTRKTFGFIQKQVFNTPTYLITKMFNHSSEETTLRYLGIQPEEIRSAYMKEI